MMNRSEGSGWGRMRVLVNPSEMSLCFCCRTRNEQTMASAEVIQGLSLCKTPLRVLDRDQNFRLSTFYLCGMTRKGYVLFVAWGLHQVNSSSFHMWCCVWDCEGILWLLCACSVVLFSCWLDFGSVYHQVYEYRTVIDMGMGAIFKCAAISASRKVPAAPETRRAGL